MKVSVAVHCGGVWISGFSFSGIMARDTETTYHSSLYIRTLQTIIIIPTFLTK